MNDSTTIANLYPELNEQQLKGAEDNLERYLAVVVRIYQRISSDEQALKKLRQDLAGLTG